MSKTNVLDIFQIPKTCVPQIFYRIFLGITPNPIYLEERKVVMEKKQRKTTEEYEQNRKRNIRHTIRTTEAEDRIIKEKADACNMSLQSYLIKMGIEGVVVIQDLQTLSHLATEINKIGVNINQIAHKVNANDFVMSEDMRSVKNKMENIYGLINELIDKNTIK